MKIGRASLTGSVAREIARLRDKVRELTVRNRELTQECRILRNRQNIRPRIERENSHE